MLLKPIDPHVHLRGQEYPEEFLRLGLKHAQASGLCCVMEQPNPVPQLVTTDIIEARNQQAQTILREENLTLGHHCHIGLTTDLEQVRQAFTNARDHVAGIRAVKAFWVHSTGSMGLLDPSYQREIWKMAVVCGYTGPVIQHCEDEAEFTGPFDPTNPVTHSWRQNPMAEYVQVEHQLRNAHDAGFRGTFYVAHVSNPATVELIRNYESQHQDAPMRLAIEACWHHFLLNTSDYERLGNNAKMNPPLRSPALQEKLLEHVLRGDITTLGTDHAPHAKKNASTPASGIPGIPFWPKGLEILQKLGIPSARLAALTFHNSNRIFSLELQPQTMDARYQPEFWEPYLFNPFARVDGSL